jgi:hypothetical protein
MVYTVIYTTFRQDVQAADQRIVTGIAAQKRRCRFIEKRRRY